MIPRSQASRARATQIVIGIAGLEVSNNPRAELVTYALGSCVAVCLYDPIRRAAGMIHIMLPLSRLAPDKAKANPAMFADTGVPLLFHQMYALGSTKCDIAVKMAGGGTVFDVGGIFDIGRRNCDVVRKLLARNRVSCAAEDVGGSKSRTVRLAMATGQVRVQSRGEETIL